MYVVMLCHSLNGVPACAHKWLLTDVMRNEFGFRGYYITDWGALNYTVIFHKYYDNYVEAAAGAANAGVNLELPDSGPVYLYLTEAVQRGLVMEQTIVNLVKPLFYTRMRLGEFDPPTSNPYASIEMSVIESEQHRELAVVAATQTFVLLKNEADTLPFTSKLHHLAVCTAQHSCLTHITITLVVDLCHKYSCLSGSTLHPAPGTTFTMYFYRRPNMLMMVDE